MLIGLVFVLCIVVVYLSLLVDASGVLEEDCAIEVAETEVEEEPAVEIEETEVADDDLETSSVALVVKLLVLATTFAFVFVLVDVDRAEEVRDVGTPLLVETLVIDVVPDDEADDERDGKLDDGVDADILLTELLSGVEDERDTGTLLAELLGEVEEEVDADRMLVELLAMGVVLDMMEVESVDDKIEGEDVVVDTLWAGVEVEEALTIALEVDVETDML